MGFVSLFLFYGAIAAIALWAYKVIYNLYFSPLKDIPGPLLYQLFPSFRLYHAAMGLEPFKIHEYHLKYGSVVRVGWNKVSFSTSEAAQTIYGNYDFAKSDKYLPFKFIHDNIFSTQNKEFHQKRKRIIAPAFSPKAVDELEPLIHTYGIEALANRIKTLMKNDEKIDLLKLTGAMSLDIIGEVAFGKSFDILIMGFHPIGDWFHYTLKMIIVSYGLPFIKPFVDLKIDRLVEFCFESINAVKDDINSSSRKTVLSNLIQAEDSETGDKLTEENIADELLIMILAGSDTTALSIVWIFYFLLKNLKVYSKLQQEVHQTFPNKQDPITYKECKDVHYITAVIQESLRTLPIAAGAVERVTPEGGRVIDGHFIPQGTLVGVLSYSLHNLPSHWSNPDQFLPERWINPETNTIKGNKNYMPFLVGPRGCIGRNMALMELHLAIATLVQKFTFEFESKDFTLTPRSFISSKPLEKEFLVKVTLNQ